MPRHTPSVRATVAWTALVSVLVVGCGPTGNGDAQVPGVLQARPAATLQVAETPSLLIGVQEGPDEYLLHDIEGAARLSDGSVAVAVRGSHQVRKYDSSGQHLWTQGRSGEGPGEYQGVMLLRGCTGDEAIATYDIYNRRVTKLDGDGRVFANYPFVFEGTQPHTMDCSPSGRLVFSGWGRLSETAGPHRWKVPVAFADSGESTVKVLRRDVPGQDRVSQVQDGRPLGDGPRVWGRRTVLGATDDGAWIGTGDDYELEFVDWDGATIRRLRWEGPELAVTAAHIDLLREAMHAQYRGRGDADWRPAFQQRWDSEREMLPTVFPAYSSILVPRSGGLWVESFRRPGQENREWWVFSDDGAWTGTLSLPARMAVVDAGADWVLVRDTDELGIQRLAEYQLVVSP